MHKDKETLGMHASDDICIPGVLRDRVHLKYPLHLLQFLSDNVCYVRNSQNSKLLDRLARYGYSVPLLVALCKEYYKGMKGCRSLYWSRVRGRKISLREFLDVLDEKTDEELAQETYTDPKSHVLTIWDWKKCISRRPMLPAQLLTYCDLVKGDPELCRRWCIDHNICITPPNLRRRC